MKKDKNGRLTNNFSLFTFHISYFVVSLRPKL